MIEDFKHMKWLPLAGGALLCVLGLTALVWPGRVAKILPLCIGAAILGLGLCEVASGFLAKSFLPEYIPGMRKLQGFVNVAVGLVFLLNRTLSLMFIAVVLGVWAVAFGALRLRDALRRRASGQPWGCCAGDAAVKFAVGIFMLASPLGSMAAWTVMVGLFSCSWAHRSFFLRYISTGCPMILRISDPARADYKQSVKTGPHARFFLHFKPFECNINSNIHAHKALWQGGRSMAGKMVEKKIRSALPLYIAAGAFLVCAAVLPVYSLPGFLGACAVAAGAYFLSDKKIPPRVVMVPAPEDPFATGEEALDAALEKARDDLEKLEVLNARIPAAALSAQISRMEKAGAAILQQVREHPEKGRDIRKFVTYYLPTAVKILTTYADLSASGAGGENAKSLMSDVEKNAGTIAAAFEAQLDALFAGEVLDVSSDIAVLDGMLSGDGLSGKNNLKLS